MIPAQGVTGKNVAVLGLGRSGLTAALALRAGGAEVRVWDDQAPARQAAEAQNLILEDLGARADWASVGSSSAKIGRASVSFAACSVTGRSPNFQPKLAKHFCK